MALSEEQAMLRNAARQWVGARSPVSALRRLRDSGGGRGFDPDAWREMAELGWTGIIIPESHGGLDFGHRSLGIVLEELGRTLTASPLLASAAAANTIALGGVEAAKAEWLGRLADGSAIGALALDEQARHAPVMVRAELTDGRLSGRKCFVHAGRAADIFIVSARVGSDMELLAVPAAAAGVSRKAIELMDSRDTAHVTFDKVVVRPDWRLLGGAKLLETVLDSARCYLAAEMLGIAQQAFDTTVEYLKNRVQFGQPIGAFQALQHRAARMYSELELSRSCVEAALEALDARSETVPRLASLAKAHVGQTLHLVSNEMVQMHGGIGMTDEHDAGLYLKRARVTEAMFGNSAFHRDRYAKLVGF